MLKTYDKIAEHTESNLYNPLTTEIPKDLKKDFEYRTSASKDIPQYIKGKMV